MLSKNIHIKPGKLLFFFFFYQLIEILRIIIWKNQFALNENVVWQSNLVNNPTKSFSLFTSCGNFAIEKMSYRFVGVCFDNYYAVSAILHLLPASRRFRNVWMKFRVSRWRSLFFFSFLHLFISRNVIQNSRNPLCPKVSSCFCLRLRRTLWLVTSTRNLIILCLPFLAGGRELFSPKNAREGKRRKWKGEIRKGIVKEQQQQQGNSWVRRRRCRRRPKFSVGLGGIDTAAYIIIGRYILSARNARKLPSPQWIGKPATAVREDGGKRMAGVWKWGRRHTEKERGVYYEKYFPTPLVHYSFFEKGNTLTERKFQGKGKINI